MPTVLITGGRAPVALDMVRLFSAAGHRVLVADSISWPLAGASRHVTKTFKVPAPRFQPEAFAIEIRTIAQQYQVDLVIPTCEEVFYLGRFKALIETFCAVLCPDLPVLERLHNKFSFASLANERGGFGCAVRAPESWLVQDRGQLKTLPHALNELVLKPTFSRFGVSTLIRPTVARADQAEISPANPWVAQRCVTGQEFCTYAICRDGEILAHVAYSSDWRAGKGASYFFDPIEAPDALAFAQGLARHFNLTGQVAFDFIREPHGQCWVLECNPRATSGLHLLADVPGVADAFLGRLTTSATLMPVMKVPRMLGLAMGIMGLPSSLRHGRLALWLRDISRGYDVLWRLADPVPIVAAAVNSGRFAVRAFKEGSSPELETTRDIEWNGTAIAPAQFKEIT